MESHLENSSPQLGVLERLPTFSTWLLIALVPILLSQAFQFTKHTLVPGIPIVGQKSFFEPLLVTRYRFLMSGWAITREGLKKYPNSPFTIVRPDSNVTVLPTRYVDELQNVHDNKLHPMEALSADMHGDITGMNIITNSHLSFNVIRNKFTPRLGSMVPTFLEEVDYALKKEMSPCKDDWAIVDLNTVLTRVISRLTSRVWVGKDLARNDDWHTVNLKTTEQIFMTALILKGLPSVLHPVVTPLLPMRRKLKKCIAEVHSYLIPEIEKRIRTWQTDGEKKEGGGEKPEDVLQWMLEAAEGEEKDPVNLATRYVYAVIGSLFTVSAGLVDCMYDLTANPEYLEPLRQEVEQVLAEDGGWAKGTAAKLVMMDSFMKESQRLNTPSPISFKRIVKEPLILSDGLTLPTNTYVCVVHTASIGRESEPFDGFRYSKKRDGGGCGVEGARSSSSTRDQYSSTDRDHNTFGHGRYACPGRFIAAVEIKMVLAEMLLRYDVKFIGGEGRPKNMQFAELGFQDPRVRVFVRERREA